MNDSVRPAHAAAARFLSAALDVAHALASFRGTLDDRLDALIRAADALGLLEDEFHTLAAPQAEQAVEIVLDLCARVRGAASTLARGECRCRRRRHSIARTTRSGRVVTPSR